jgi:hypothetical protein
MSKNVKVNDKTYNGVSTVELPLASGSGTALFKGVDEITVPSGTKSITANGTYDVSAFASAEVNVPYSDGSGGVYEGIIECRQITFTPEDQNNGTTFSVAHGCSATPDIVLIVANEESPSEDFRTSYQIKKYVIASIGKFATSAGGSPRALRTYGNKDTEISASGEAVVNGENIVFTNLITQRWCTVPYTMWCIVF